MLKAAPNVWSRANLVRVLRTESLDSRISFVLSSRSSSFSLLEEAASMADFEGTRWVAGKADSRNDCLESKC